MHITPTPTDQGGAKQRPTHTNKLHKTHTLLHTECCHSHTNAAAPGPRPTALFPTHAGHNVTTTQPRGPSHYSAGSSVFNSRNRPAASRILLNSMQKACTSMNRSCVVAVRGEAGRRLQAYDTMLTRLEKATCRSCRIMSSPPFPPLPPCRDRRLFGHPTSPAPRPCAAPVSHVAPHGGRADPCRHG